MDERHHDDSSSTLETKSDTSDPDTVREGENTTIFDHDSHENSELRSLSSGSGTFLSNSPVLRDTEALASSDELESHPLEGSSVLLQDSNVIQTSVDLLPTSIVLTSSALPNLCPSLLSTEQPSSEILQDDISDNEGSDNLLMSKNTTQDDLMIDPKNDQIPSSCIRYSPRSSDGEGTNNESSKLVETPSSVSIDVVVTTQQTSMSYFHQILDHKPITSPSQATSLGIASALPELHSCKWLNCCKNFILMEDLVNHVNESHIRVENSQEDYCCQWEGCTRNGKGFNARYKMSIHMRTHTGERPHKCMHDSCGKSFSRLENLKIHHRSHTGEKPYVCPVSGCGKRYSNSSDRFKHTRTHYERKPYHCKVVGCGKQYTDPSSLRKHLKTRHGHDMTNEEHD